MVVGLVLPVQHDGRDGTGLGIVKEPVGVVTTRGFWKRSLSMLAAYQSQIEVDGQSRGRGRHREIR